MERYEPVRLPALSLLVGHAFFWETHRADTGQHELRLRARFREAAPQDVVLIVELAPSTEDE